MDDTAVTAGILAEILIGRGIGRVVCQDHIVYSIYGNVEFVDVLGLLVVVAGQGVGPVLGGLVVLHVGGGGCHMHYSPFILT